MARFVEVLFYVKFGEFSVSSSNSAAYSLLGNMIISISVGLVVLTLMVTLPPAISRPYRRGSLASFLLATSLALVSAAHCLILGYGIKKGVIFVYREWILFF